MSNFQKKIFINLRKFLQMFLLAEAFPQSNKMFIVHRQILLNNLNEFPWVKKY